MRNFQTQIISRDNPNISHVVSKWVNVQDKRSQLYGKRLDEMTYYQMCLATKTDCQIMWKELESAIPELQNLSRWDQEALLRNFQPKWSLLAAAIDFYKNHKAYENIRTPEDYSEVVVRFYTASLYGGTVLEPEEILRVFLPFLQFYGTMLAMPICAKKFDSVEYMALAMMILFDGAHTNITPECSTLCHNIRNVILRELRAYHSNQKNEMRFIETVDTVQLLEKGESKFQEELLLLEMYNVHIHDDYRLISREYRACAAFFRRYFHSKKSPAACTCEIRFRNSHPCRECRIQKCLALGMNPEKVQQKREKHVAKNPQLPSSSSSSPPSLPISPIPTQILPRDCSKIALTTSNWQKMQPKRSLLFEKTLDQTNYYELSCIMREDCLMVWKIVEDLFPQAIWNLRVLDKEALLRNFLPKWSVLTAAIDMEMNIKRYSKWQSIEDCQRMIVDFYMGSMPERYRMTPLEILKAFGPILAYYGEQVIFPIHKKGLDKAEYMALALIILFDGAYTNISVECSEMCRNLRNLIFRELKGYQMDKNYEEIQFIDTIDTLNMVEKGERKFHEELLVCDMHHVHLHDDYRLLMKELNG
uniref:NR LBD domain-containing protein n=1 Tax=Caenorhabditis tropicalis TaxID=1561998 RepID=A0A1I7TUE8_9PELO